MARGIKKALFLLTSTLALVGASGFARAHHALTKPDQAEIDWAGFYGGLDYGVAISPTNGEHLLGITGGLPPAYNIYPQVLTHPGVTAGGHVGYNWQNGHFVYGFETELNYLGGRHTPDGVSLAPPAPYGLQWDQSASYFASLRARAGYAIGPWLPFVTGGVATGGARGPAELLYPAPGLNGLFTAASSQSSRMKFAIGAGLAYAIDDSWSARVEYLYLNQQLQTQIFANGSGNSFASHSRPEDHILRFGIDYHFGSENEISENGSEAQEHTEFYSVHGQTTHFVQGYPKFPALYSGQNSLPPQGLADAGSLTDLFIGLRTWEGAGVFLDPEIIQGYALNDSFGAASYVNAALQPIGSGAPYMRFERYFLKQIIGLDSSDVEEADQTGSHNETLEAAQNQLAGKVSRNRLMLTIGKFAVPDVFDDNVYAHDPTRGFFNFAFNNMLAFDYAQDTWGYTYGAAAEWKQDWWTARAGVFQLSQIPLGPVIEPELLRQYMAVTELEGRYELFGQPGEIKFLAYADNGYFAKVSDAVDNAYATDTFPPQLSCCRSQRHVKTGGGINLQQQLIKDLGFFMRASMADGRYETIEFLDVDRSVSAGFVAGGSWWGRSTDEIGIGAGISGLAAPRVKYFALGGTDSYIGDGALSYAAEKTMEAYYKVVPVQWLEVTLDYQLLIDPAYNTARGPVNVFGLRLNAKF